MCLVAAVKNNTSRHKTNTIKYTLFQSGRGIITTTTCLMASEETFLNMKECKNHTYWFNAQRKFYLKFLKLIPHHEVS